MALSRKRMDDKALAERLEAMLVNTADGRRSVADDRQYPDLRLAVINRGLNAPAFVYNHPSLDSFSVAIKKLKTKDARVREVRDQFEQFTAELDAARENPIDSALWTGVEGRAARLKLVRGLL